MSHNTWVHCAVRPAVRPLIETPIAPNHITWLRLFGGLAAAAAFAQGDDFWRNWGAAIFLFSFLLDRADGELARLSGKKSSFGHRLDLVSDALSNALAFVGLGLGLRNGTFGPWAPVMGIVAALAVGAILTMVMRIENSEGDNAAELRLTKSLDPDDGMVLVPVLIWLSQGELLLALASVGAPLFCAGMAIMLRRRLIKPATVALPNGMTVSCLQKHEVPLVYSEVQGYLSNGLKLGPGDIVFDVGANIGLFSLAAYENCGRNLKIYAFEPVTAIFDLLRANIERNTADSHVHVLPFGLSHCAATAPLAYYPRAPVLSTAYPDEEADLLMIENIVLNNIVDLDDAPLLVRGIRWIPKALCVPLVRFALRTALRTEIVHCQMRTLSWFVAEQNIDRIDLLKIDVEKAELDVLSGIEDPDWDKIQQAVIELHDLDDRLNVITTLLQRKGLTELTVEQPPTLAGSNIFTVFAARPPACTESD